MNVCAIIVTYGNRYNLIEKVAMACIEDGIDHIIIVDNGSPLENKIKLGDFANSHKKNIEIVRSEENLGSAGGYARGIKKAISDAEYEYFLLLDDDNLIDKQSFISLLKYWNERLSEEEKGNSALLALREDRDYYVRFATEQHDNILLGSANSFMHYGLFDYKKSNSSISKKNDKIKSPIAPYGGLFLSLNLLNKIGLPLEEMFLYIDDIEFSYRITTNGGGIYIVPDSTVIDIDQSWGSKESNNNNRYSSPVLEEKESFRIYYTFRNRAYFEYNYRVNNKAYYFLNMFFLLSKLSIKAIYLRKLKRLSLILWAVYDGVRGNLGVTDRKL